MSTFFAVLVLSVIILFVLLVTSTSQEPADEMEKEIEKQRKLFDQRFNPDFRQRAYDERDIYN